MRPMGGLARLVRLLDRPGEGIVTAKGGCAIRDRDASCSSSVVAHVPGRTTSGGDGQHGKAKGDHHQAHEFESKSVHENFPKQVVSLVGVALSVP